MFDSICLEKCALYHQIEAMEKAGNTGGSTLDNFTHYQYAPTTASSNNAGSRQLEKKDGIRRASIRRQSQPFAGGRFELTTSHGFGDHYLSSAMPSIN